MARIRTIKPEFWTDSDVVMLTPWARLFFIGLWNFTMCDKGHLLDDPASLKLQILPADDVDPFALVDELVTRGRVVRLTDENGRRYLWVRRFTDHQKLEKRWAPRCPACNAEDLYEPPPSRPTTPNLAETRGSLVEHAETPPTSPKLPEPLPRTVKEGRGGDRTGQVPPTAGDVVAATSVEVAPTVEPTTQTLIGEWVDHCQARPPGQVLGQVSKLVKQMLDEGIPYDHVRAGLAAWQTKGLHPASLPSVVHETRTQHTRAPTVVSTTDARMAAVQALKADLRPDQRSIGA